MLHHLSFSPCKIFSLIFTVRHYQPPLDATDPDAMLMMILWWKDMILGYSYFMSAGVASINARPWRRSAGFVQLVERFVVTFGDEIGVLVECH
jgi:hypothetical protein